MNDLKLDSSHDLVVDNNDLVMLNSVEDVAAQSVKVRILTYRGEWKYNTSLGVPYLQQIFKAGASKPFVDGVMKRTIRNTYGIESIDAFVSTLNNRVYEVIEFRGTTRAGDIVSIDNLQIS